MSVSQIVRTSSKDDNNPTGLVSDLLGISRILVNNVPPISTTGRTSDYYIDSSSNDLYGPKAGSVWGAPVYNFSGGGGGGTITNLSNEGGGVRSFIGLNGTVAQLRTLTSGGNDVVIEEDTPEADTLNFSIADAYKPVSLSLVNNNVLNVGVGSGTFDPNGLLGEDDGYNRGSIFIQIGTSDKLWALNDPAGKVWLQIAGDEVGVKSIQNTETFGGQFFRDTVDGVASFKVLRGAPTIDVINFGTNFVDMKVADSYKPLTLDKVYNIQDNRTGSLSAPTVGDDSGAGYARGSIWVEQEISGTNKIWICNSAAIGSADWQEYSPSSASKESAMFFDFNQPLISFPNTNWNNLGVSSASVNFSGSATWSAVFSGDTIVFRRGPTTSTGKRYLVVVSPIINDIGVGATTEQHNYDFRMLQNPSAIVQNSSFMRICLNGSPANTRGGQSTANFIITSTTASTDEYYLQIRSTITGSIAAAPNVSIEHLTVTFTEI